MIRMLFESKVAAVWFLRQKVRLRPLMLANDTVVVFEECDCCDLSRRPGKAYHPHLRPDAQAQSFERVAPAIWGFRAPF